MVRILSPVRKPKVLYQFKSPSSTRRSSQVEIRQSGVTSITPRTPVLDGMAQAHSHNEQISNLIKDTAQETRNIRVHSVIGDAKDIVFRIDEDSPAAGRRALEWLHNIKYLSLEILADE
jgi:hypothetical protein